MLQIAFIGSFQAMNGKLHKKVNCGIENGNLA